MMGAQRALIEHCLEVGLKMNTQDNRSTAWPLFVVEEKVDIFNPETGEKVDDEWRASLEHGVFLTAKACDLYIEGRRYDFRNQVRSYGISAYRSKETARLMYLISQLAIGPNENSYPKV